MYQWPNKAQQNAIVVLTSQRDFLNPSNIFLLRCCIENYAFLSFIKPWRYSWPRFENVCLRPSRFSFNIAKEEQSVKHARYASRIGQVGLEPVLQIPIKPRGQTHTFLKDDPTFASFPPHTSIEASTASSWCSPQIRSFLRGKHNICGKSREIGNF